ncbi:hypothetical protein WR25_22854 [Diploscapter pachys]|uniref:Uncharacterized protein n=1 Tax=Diploscapter pachys TaxID=2018661 RepID=A0A2A2M4S2_9BILA|nr:hypothetical protein WR25_22854 [Diploscapter pachys]
MGVDQLMVDRRGIGQQSQPAERIDPLVHLQHAGRDALPGHAMEAIAAGDVIALDPVLATVLVERQVRPRPLDVMGLDIVGRIDDRRPTQLASLHQVAGDLGLAVDHHRLASGQCLEVKTLAMTTDQQLDPFMDQPFAIHALGHAGFAQQLDRALFEHAGTDAPQHIVRGLALDDQRIDAGVVQQLAEQQAGRAGADDCNLSLHCCCLTMTMPALHWQRPRICC